MPRTGGADGRCYANAARFGTASVVRVNTDTISCATATREIAVNCLATATEVSKRVLLRESRKTMQNRL
ncbi:MAG: hypothetical protein FWD58_07230 [Firmicutes bacterium]|nr:hypothetical protein [Bacillota bacterium]